MSHAHIAFRWRGQAKLGQKIVRHRSKSRPGALFLKILPESGLGSLSLSSSWADVILPDISARELPSSTICTCSVTEGDRPDIVKFSYGLAGSVEPSA